MNPAVSIVIPSYNHEQYIEAAIRSVLQQTLHDLELIIIDDGSSDGSRALLEKFNDPRVQVLFQENHGAHATINRGLKMARGKYLAILNSDDEYMSDRLELAVAALEKDLDVGFVSSWIEVVDGEGGALGTKRGWENMLPWPGTRPDIKLKGLDEFALNLLASNFISTTSNIVMRRELFEEVGEFRNLRFAHDWDFCLRAVAAHNARIIRKPLMKYRVHGTNTIRQDQTGMIFEVYWVLASNLPLFLDRLGQVTSAEGMRDFIDWLTGSLHTFGNDRLFMMLFFLISSGCRRENEDPCVELLDVNNPVRSWCLERIQENSECEHQPEKSESRLMKLVQWLSHDEVR